MAKRPVISKETQVLLKLLRIALRTEPRKYFGEVLKTLCQIFMDNGLTPIIFEGVWAVLRRAQQPVWTDAGEVRVYEI